MADLVARGLVSATTDFSVVKELDTVNICVPTPLRKTKDPDMSYIVSAVEAIAAHLHPGMLVVLESTTYPGTTEELVLPLLEKSGLKAGLDFFLAFSPGGLLHGNPPHTGEFTIIEGRELCNRPSVNHKAHPRKTRAPPAADPKSEPLGLISSPAPGIYRARPGSP